MRAWLKIRASVARGTEFTKVNENTEKLSRKTGVSEKSISQAFSSGNVFSMNRQVDIISLINKYREKRIAEAERKGYMEAKEIYTRRIDALNKKLLVLKTQGDSELRELASLIAEMFAEIGQEQMKIAELRILLQGA